MGEEVIEYDHSMEMKIGGMIIFGSVFIVGIVLLIVYVKMFKKYHSPHAGNYNEF